MITLTRTSPVLSGIVSVNTARCTWSSPTISILSAVAASWLLRSVIPVQPSETNVVTITITNPGVASITLSTSCHVFAAGGTLIGSTYGATVTIAAGASYTWTLTSATSTAAVEMRVDVSLAATSGSGWTARVDEMTSKVTATATDVIAANLDVNLNRTAEPSTTGAPIIAQGAIGKPAGQVTYLADTLAAAQAVRDIHRGNNPVVAVDGPLAGLVYWATGTVRMQAEKAIAGNPSRWLVTAPVTAAA